MTDDEKDIVPQESDFLLYTSPEGDVHVDVLFQGETVWLTQKRMGELFLGETRKNGNDK